MRSDDYLVKPHWLVLLAEHGFNPMLCYGGDGGDDGDDGGDDDDDDDDDEDEDEAEVEVSEPVETVSDLTGQEMSDLGLGGAQGSVEVSAADPGAPLDPSGPAEVGYGPSGPSVADITTMDQAVAPDVNLGLDPEASFTDFGVAREDVAVPDVRDELAAAMSSLSAAPGQPFDQQDFNPNAPGIFEPNQNFAIEPLGATLAAQGNLLNDFSLGNVTGYTTTNEPGTPGLLETPSGPPGTQGAIGTSPSGYNPDFGFTGSPYGQNPQATTSVAAPVSGQVLDPGQLNQIDQAQLDRENAVQTFGQNQFNPIDQQQVDREQIAQVLDPTQANRIDQQQIDRENQVASYGRDQLNPIDQQQIDREQQALMFGQPNPQEYRDLLGPAYNPPTIPGTPPAPPPAPPPTQMATYAPAQLTPIDQQLIDQERALGINREPPQGPIDRASDRGLAALQDFFGGQQGGASDPGANAGLGGGEVVNQQQRRAAASPLFASANQAAAEASPLTTPPPAQPRPAPPASSSPYATGAYQQPGFNVAQLHSYPPAPEQRSLRDQLAAALLAQTQDRLRA